MSETNGTHNGVWHTLTLPDSGATLQYRPVSHMLLADAGRSVRKPTPPLVDIHYGDTVRQEPNPNSPEYQEALRNYANAQKSKALETAVLLGVMVEVDEARVNDLRQALADSGIELPKNDKVLYVTRILCETANDLTALGEAIVRRSQPTEAAIAEKTETFQPPV